MSSASPAAAFFAAQDAAVRASTALRTAMGTSGKGILVEVPANQPVPYVLLGDNQVVVEKTDCGQEAEVTATVSWWSRKSPLDKGAQAIAMGAALISALFTELTVDGWECILCELQSESYVTDPDQSTHGSAVLRYELTEIVT